MALESGRPVRGFSAAEKTFLLGILSRIRDNTNTLSDN